MKTYQIATQSGTRIATPGPDSNEISVRDWLAVNPQMPVLDLDCGPDAELAA